MAQSVAHAHDEHQAQNQENINKLGFWIFLVTDVILFGTLFATFSVIHTHYDGGPTGKDVFNVPGFITETFLLLTSSFTSGLAALAMNSGKKKQLIGWLIVTVLLGLGFIGFEVKEFTDMATSGASISRSAFLSSFFVLVGTHGCHVSIGLIWMTSIIIQLTKRGITPMMSRKVFMVSLYWHFLDAVWIFIFTVVYLMGVM